MPESPDAILIRHLKPSNFLSFGPEFEGVELQSLNILIGPNGSGKSNLIEAINLMRAAPKDFREVTRKGGGVGEWVWKGRPKDYALIESTFNHPSRKRSLVKLKKLPATQLRHAVVFRDAFQAFAMYDEIVDDGKSTKNGESDTPFYHYRDGEPTVISAKNGKFQLDRNVIERDRSILAQLRDPDAYPELTWLSENYEKIRIYREWAFGRNAIFREPQKADMRNDVLEEDFSNLGMFLNRLKTRFPAAKRLILACLKDLYDGIDDFDVSVEGGSVQVFFTERDFVIPAIRLSDGTLRFLCLLAILSDPEPPPLICLEEPELGLHPDILPKVADLLRAASERTQLIVTTHSDILVDAMSEMPEAVVVCSKSEGKTNMERLNAKDLSEWLTKYRLGQLWTKGEIGGTRW